MLQAGSLRKLATVAQRSFDNNNLARLLPSVSPAETPFIKPTLEDDIKAFARKEPQAVSLKSLVEVGLGTRPWLSSMREAFSLRDAMSSLNDRLSIRTHECTATEKGILRMATFLHRELPVRLARGVDQLDALVQDQDLLKAAPDLQWVRDCYATSFQEIRKAPSPTDKVKEADFVRVLDGVRERHADELLHMARGVYQLRSKIGLTSSDSVDSETYEIFHKYLDQLHLKRIALRILIGHYLALHHDKREDYVGIVCLKTKLKDVIEVATNDAQWICKRKYGFAPEVEIVGGDDLILPIIPEHLYYVALELIKNSLRAQAERFHHEYTSSNAAAVPSIQVMLTRDYSLSDGPQVLVEVLDHGGGIPVESFDRIFCYLFTTAEPEVQASMMGRDDVMVASKKVPLAGLGYGLPISKIYAYYHGGELEIVNRLGEGCSALLRLSRVADRKEPLV